MEAPKCKLCGERHYGLCASNKPKRLRLPYSSDPEPIEEPWATEDAAKKAVTKAMEGVKLKFDRTAYHRAYMKEYIRAGAVGKHAPTAKRPLPALPVGSPPKFDRDVRRFGPRCAVALVRRRVF